MSRKLHIPLAGSVRLRELEDITGRIGKRAHAVQHGRHLLDIRRRRAGPSMTLNGVVKHDLLLQKQIAHGATQKRSLCGGSQHTVFFIWQRHLPPLTERLHAVGTGHANGAERPAEEIPAEIRQPGPLGRGQR